MDNQTTKAGVDLPEIFAAIDEAQRLNRYNESSFTMGAAVARLKCLADDYRARQQSPVTGKMDCSYCGGKGEHHQERGVYVDCNACEGSGQARSTRQAAPEAPTAVKDALRRCGANTDYHGKMVFTVAQFNHFVSMIAPATHQATLAAPADDRQNLSHADMMALCAANPAATSGLPLKHPASPPKPAASQQAVAEDICQVCGSKRHEPCGNVVCTAFYPAATTASASSPVSKIERLDDDVSERTRTSYRLCTCGGAAQAAHAGAVSEQHPHNKS